MSENEKITSALEIFTQAMEAAVVQLRQNLGKPTQAPRVIESWNPDKIRWRDQISLKDDKPFQMSEDVNNLEFKKMLKLLQDAGGMITRKNEKIQVGQEQKTGNVLYWIFPNGATVGRKYKGA